MMKMIASLHKESDDFDDGLDFVDDDDVGLVGWSDSCCFYW